ncbi:MAG: hypothetical protein KGR22_04870 [Planctomycetes bacterium]|nr:hypothetical protein [Planctomycetota bacterium]
MNTILRTMLVVACSALAVPVVAQDAAPVTAESSAASPIPAPSAVKKTTPSQVAQAARSLRRSMACEACGGDGTVVRQRTRKAEKLFTKGQIYHEQDACSTCKGTGSAKAELIMQRFDALVLAMAGCPDELAKNAPATKILTEVFDSITAFARTRNAEAVDKAAQRLAGGFGDEPGTPLVAIGVLKPSVDLGLGAASMVMELPSGALIAIDEAQFHSAKSGDRALGAGVVRGHAIVGKNDYLVIDRGFVLMVTSEKDLKIQEEEAEAARRAAREPVPAPEPRETPRAPDDEEMPER